MLGNPNDRNAQLKVMKAEWDNKFTKGDRDQASSVRSKATSVNSVMLKEHQRYKSGLVNDMSGVQPSHKIKQYPNLDSPRPEMDPVEEFGDDIENLEIDSADKERILH